MKNVIILLASLFVTFISTQGQVTQCVSCNNNTIDTTKYSSTIGTENISTGLNSFAAGNSNVVEGEYSTAMGINHIVSSDKSHAIGYQDTVSATGSIAIGTGVSVTGMYSIGFGINSKVYGNYSAAIGNRAISAGMNSYAFGNNVWADAQGSIAIGVSGTYIKNTVPNSLMAGFNSDLPTFFIGTSSGSGTTGKVGIGNITAPTAKLHIKADNTEDADIKLERGNSNRVAKIIFNDEDHIIASNLNNGLTFKTPGTTAFHFEGGNIGIGTEEPQAKLQVSDGDIFIEDIDRGIIMKSPDGNCWRGTLDNSGALQFVQVDCNNLTTGTKQTNGSQPSGAKIYPNPAGDKVFVYIDQIHAGTTLEISDLSGRTIFTEKLKNAESYIDMSSFSTGLHIFRIVNGNGEEVLSEKVIKQ